MVYRLASDVNHRALVRAILAVTVEDLEKIDGLLDNSLKKLIRDPLNRKKFLEYFEKNEGMPLVERAGLLPANTQDKMDNFIRSQLPKYQDLLESKTPLVPIQKKQLTPQTKKFLKNLFQYGGKKMEEQVKSFRGFNPAKQDQEIAQLNKARAEGQRTLQQQHGVIQRTAALRVALRFIDTLN